MVRLPLLSPALFLLGAGFEEDIVVRREVVDDEDVGDVAVVLAVVHAVAEDERVGDVEALIVDLDVDLAAVGAVEEARDLEARGAALLESFEEVIECLAAVDDILDDEDVFRFHAGVEVFGDSDDAGGA